MPDRHTLLNSKALSTLLNPNDRISKIQDGGYGDFCFAPNKNYKCLDCFDPFNPTTYATTAAETVSDSLSELSISEAAASALQISFLKLPKDIRDIIYEYWIEPFRNPWYNGTIKVQVGVVHEMRCHPFRNGYTVGIPLSIKSSRSQPHNGSHHDIPHQHISRVYYERLRALSQVSRQLRSELGAIFWSNVYVDIDHWEYLFVDFLNDRPAICGGIKRLRMEWACDENATDLDGGWNGIIQFCEFVKDKLVLDELEFVLDTTPMITREILALRENLAWVRAFREIKTKKLKLRLFLCPDDEEDIDDDSSDDSDNSDENNEHSLENDGSGDDGTISGSEHASENEDGDESGADGDSDSSSSSSEDSLDLDFVEEERRTELLASTLEPLMETLLGPDIPQIVGATEADEYLASRRAQEAEEEGSESSSGSA